MFNNTLTYKKLGLIALMFLAFFALFAAPAYAEEDQYSCKLASMKERYYGDDAAKSCWYCKVVIVMTNAYLSAVGKAISVSQTLGHTILRTGFSIWLAWYILQQVSSASAITPGKMLQEILIMGFKVALASAAVTSGIDVIRDYMLNPIMMTGIDYGSALLDQLMPNVDNM